MLAQLGDAGHAVHDFAQNKFARYKPTGETPQRQQYSFPRDFVRSRPHDQLLREFDEALNTPAAEPLADTAVVEDSVVDEKENAPEMMEAARSVVCDECKERNCSPSAIILISLLLLSYRSKLPVFAPSRRQLGALNNE